LGLELPDPAGVEACLKTLAIGDGSYTNDSDIRMGNVPATAAAVTLQHQFGWAIDPKSVDFLLSCCHPEGGFFAVEVAPMPDLLSTAVALHALSAAKADISAIKEPCLDFLDTLWTARGSFYGNWAEEEDDLDVEYTYYALLALGHLSL
jgi:prenyltransferase beta subunit